MSFPPDHKYTLYAITNLYDGRKYVGATGHDAEARFKYHWACRRLPGSPLWQAMKRLGRHNFKVEWIASALGKSNAEAVERQLISQFDCQFPNGYNLNAGGPGRMTKDRKPLATMWLEASFAEASA